MTFSEFFRTATGHDPFPYQRRLIEADSLPHLLNIPTGGGQDRGGRPGLAVAETVREPGGSGNPVTTQPPLHPGLRRVRLK
jgi:CRISPR-associated endonuclease/helicase Cas3